ncbi:MAG: bifunctional diguanylate cyclase/phosphodiesterase [Candidatus Eremiobacteraeota bacterium]|nr:bifunctional diguanylate cyclase/phosphodiesterase [Candidatus Eremiobacteraeota bacterium]
MKSAVLAGGPDTVQTTRLERLWHLTTDIALDAYAMSHAVLYQARDALGADFAAVGPLDGDSLQCEFTSGSSAGKAQVALAEAQVYSRFDVDGKPFALLFGGMAPSAEPDDGEGGYVAQVARFFAFSAQRATKRIQLTALACEDPTTGLPNQAVCLDWVKSQYRRLDVCDEQVALMIVGLDRFAEVNVTFGHETGDRALARAAGLLHAAAGQAELIGRIGGAEFCVGFLGGRDAQALESIGRDIVAAFAAPLELDERSITLSASVGAALSGPAAPSADALFGNSHEALARARREPLAKYCFYGEEITEQLRQRRSVQDDLRRALDRDEFCLFYQPVVDLATGNVEGAEALIRWDHPQRGRVCPTDFVPQAEEAGLMVPIGAWVIERAMRQCRQWSDAGMKLHVSVNVSAKHLESAAFTKQVGAAIARTGVDPTLMEIEITEGVAMKHAAIVALVLAELKRMGIRIALDDFGTGYSSLAYLKSLPVNIIKIDRAFIAGVPLDNDDTSIVRAIIAFSLCTGRQVRAEGVETLKQARWLNAEGCDMAQGYLFGKPLNAPDFSVWHAAYVAEGADPQRAVV